MTSGVHHVHPCPSTSGHVRPPSGPLGRTGGQSADRRNRTTNVWRVRAADSQTGEIRYSRLFQQLHAAKSRAVVWRDHGYDITIEVGASVEFAQVWP